jgi:hypothetical protein
VLTDLTPVFSLEVFDALLQIPEVFLSASELFLLDIHFFLEINQFVLTPTYFFEEGSNLFWVIFFEVKFD